MTKPLVYAFLVLAGLAVAAPAAVADLTIRDAPPSRKATPQVHAGRPICREERQLLPEQPGAGGLPTKNAFTGAPGCYVACYTHDEHIGLYSVGQGIYVAGQYRTLGRYDARICRPDGFEQADLSALATFKEQCTKYVPACEGKCWAGGDTGGFLGLSEGRQCQAERAEPPHRHGRGTR